MPKFILAYHGGGMPESPEDQAKTMEAWGAYYGAIGENLADGGAPVGMSKTVTADGSVEDNGGSNPLSGYTVVNADNIEAACEMAKKCPIRDMGGSIEVAECMEM